MGQHMAQFFLSSNPTATFDPFNDIFQVDTTSAANLQVSVSGTTVTFTDGTNTATFNNVLLTQFDVFNVAFLDGSLLSLGDNQPGIPVTPDNAANTLDGSNVANGLGNSGPVINVTATTFNDQIRGFGGDDIINGLAGNDLIYGNEGNDTITGTSGIDVVYGGQGDDIVNYSGHGAGNGASVLSLVGVTISGNAGSDLIYGSLANDIIYGNQTNGEVNNVPADGADTIYGGAGSDRIYGNQGDDLIFGLGDATFNSTLNGPSSTYTLDIVYGGQGNDTINYAGDSQAPQLILYGNLGNDLIYGSKLGSSNTPLNDFTRIYGGGGNDTIYGGRQNGNESLYGEDGNDTIFGDQGVTVNRASLYIDGGAGNDTINARNTGINISVDPNLSKIIGGVGADNILGGYGNDLIYGGVPGGEGAIGDNADVIDGGDGDDIIYGNQGNDQVVISVGLFGPSFLGGADLVYGGQGNDNINYTGDTFAVKLYGGLGSDTLVGGDGADILVAGDDADTLTGNLGVDVFNYANGGLGTFITGTSTITADVATDFVSGVDKLVTGRGAGTSTNYLEFADIRATSVEAAFGVYNDAQNNNPLNNNATYTFIAGPTNGYLIVDNNGTATDGVDGVLALTGHNALSGATGFAFTDITG